MQNFVVEKSWWYRNFQCSVIFTRQAFRCGYIIVPKGYYVPKAYGYADIKAHGGVTFDEEIKHSMGIRVRERGMQISDGVRMVGFDCGHAWDGQDHALAIRLFGEQGIDLSCGDDVLKTLEFCEAECRNMVDQVIALDKDEYREMINQTWEVVKEE